MSAAELGPVPASAPASTLRGSYWAALVSLFTSSSTLVCCALPALLVALGAGAVMSSLVSLFPQLVWLSENKEALFIGAGVMLGASGVLQWRSRSAPCPIEPTQRAACLQTRKVSFRVYALSLVVYAVGGWFAFVQPWLADAA
jgi:hypothetical protein